MVITLINKACKIWKLNVQKVKTILDLNNYPSPFYNTIINDETHRTYNGSSRNNLVSCYIQSGILLKLQNSSSKSSFNYGIKCK